ncbi:MAG: hypothetical protein ABIT37_08580 [Luteolibacter sp.]
MKSPYKILALMLASVSAANADSGSVTVSTASSYTNFIRQVQLPTGIQWDASVAAAGEQNSSLALDLGGARFELWTVKNSPLTSYLLDTKFVSTFSPAATVAIRTEDPYAMVPRTRADRPFYVDVTVSGLVPGTLASESGKAVTLMRHVQSYGLGGVGNPIDRSQATLLSQSSITANGAITLTYAMTSVPAANLTKAAGEERFSVWTVADATSPTVSQLASRYVQIWPLADGSISGITQGQKIRFTMPQVTLTLNDLYPSSDTYAQIYPGAQKLGTVGTRITTLIVNDSIPKSKVLILKDYDPYFTQEGTWTMEILTTTPFGTDRLSYVTFDLNRTLRVNSMITSAE